MVFGADIIAGFPTETEAMFENSLTIVEEANLTYLHVFPFSPRPGTPAAKMPQLGSAVARERAKQLRALGARRFAAHLQSRLGRIESVLVERDGFGRTAQFTPIALPGHAAGEIVAARVVGTSPSGLVGDALRAAA
jgi:threonylcarbamoyladenosine tRNA methylthiotransferase MtaB